MTSLRSTAAATSCFDLAVDQSRAEQMMKTVGYWFRRVYSFRYILYEALASHAAIVHSDHALCPYYYHIMTVERPQAVIAMLQI